MGDELAGLPELAVTGLREDYARALLDSVLTGPLDAQVRDLIVAETHGNPLALLELPRGLSPAELAGGFGLPGAAALPSRIEDSFRAQLATLPASTRTLLLLAAAEPSGDRSLVERAAARLGVPIQAAGPAQEAGLLEMDARIRFRHPLLRAAAYRAAAVADRRAAHGALAAATDAAVNPDRRAWHRAQAADGPDEQVAAELERSADRAAGPWRAGRGGRVPGTLGAAHRGPGPPRRAHAGGGAGQPAGRSVRQGPGPAGDRGSRAAGRGPKCPGGPAARAGGIRLRARQRRTAAAAQGGPAAGAARPRPGPRDVPDRLAGGAVRRAPGLRRRPARGGPGRAGIAPRQRHRPAPRILRPWPA